MNPLRPVFLIGSTAFWLVMTSLLIHKEFFQLAPLQGSYQVLPLQDWDLRQEYHAIFLGKERIGFNWNLLEKKGEDSYEFRHSTYLSFLFLGQAREMLVKQIAHLDRQLTMQDFSIRISSADTWTKIQGQTAKDNLNIIIENSGSPPVRRIVPVRGRLFFAEALDFLWTPENLKIGKQGTVKIWNPLSLAVHDIHFHVQRKEKIQSEGIEKEAYVIRIKFADLEMRSWVSPEGVMLQAESPTGFLLKKEEAWKIFDSMREKRSSPPDLPNLFSIPSNQILKNPPELSYLKARLQTPKEDKIIEIRRADLGAILRASKARPEESQILRRASLAPNDIAPYLQPTPWIQSNDPNIIQTAKEIAGRESSPLQIALKLNEWVHQNISPVPTVSLPQAAEVLQSRKGDCNEYTVLYTALARALGLPAKMKAGLVYQNGRFFYHAWPEVYLGEWVAMDPTFGQAPADATHIPLMEGDLEEQVELSNQIGRIKMMILETSETKGAKP